MRIFIVTLLTFLVWTVFLLPFFLLFEGRQTFIEKAFASISGLFLVVSLYLFFYRIVPPFYDYLVYTKQNRRKTVYMDQTDVSMRAAIKSLSHSMINNTEAEQADKLLVLQDAFRAHLASKYDVEEDSITLNGNYFTAYPSKPF